jgi:hypothetical protein
MADYSANSFISQEQDQQRLLSPSMSSPGSSSAYPSMLQSVQLLSYGQGTQYHHTPMYNGYENIKEPEVEDAARCLNLEV